MTIPEAARLVLQAAAIGQTGQVLVLDMGEPARIVDLARDLIRLSGNALDKIPIVFSGLRPGEKLFEELLADADDTLPTAVPRLRVARLASASGAVSRPDAGSQIHDLLAWAATVLADPGADLRVRLQSVVTEYKPASHPSAPGTAHTGTAQCLSG